MKLFFKNPFSDKNKGNNIKTPEQNILLFNKVMESIKKCESDKSLAYKDIDNIKKWSKEIIWEIFIVPGTYWYEELKEYENIKNSIENSSISNRVINSCDSVITGYREQIKVREAKIKFCEALIEEYQITKEKLEQTMKKIAQLKKEDKQIKMLDVHTYRIKEMNNESANMEKIYVERNNLDFLNIDIQSIEHEFELQEELLCQMNTLTKNFLENKTSDNKLVYIEEIERLIAESKKIKFG